MGCAKKFGSQIGFHSHANVTFAKCFSYFSYRSNCCCCCAYSKKKNPLQSISSGTCYLCFLQLQKRFLFAVCNLQYFRRLAH